jgi:3D (Asp-Asp-Asp) domain-containing protein
MLALLSASLIFHAQPSVAESLALASPESQTQTKRVSAAPVRPDGSGETVTPAEPSADTNPATSSNTVGAIGESAAALSVETKQTTPPAGNVDKQGEAAGPAQQFTATAYALRGRTASGKFVARGLIAADRRVLPIGTRVRVEAGSYSGEYTVADTGGAVRGRKIDIWVPSTSEAMRFGRRPVKLTVLTRVRPRTTGKQGQPAK